MTDRTQKGARAECIVVVDDDEAIRKSIVSILVAADYECREAASGLEALSLLESGDTVDLMLYDLRMPLPNFGGIGLLERATKRYPDMPVVIVTAIYDVSVVLETIHNGAFDYLLKPFEREQLLHAVGRALEHRRLKLAHRAYVSNLESQVAALY
jgi:DNA-binding NtrC family response regulator